MTTSYLTSVSNHAEWQEASATVCRCLLLAILRETPEVLKNAVKCYTSEGQIMLLQLPASIGILAITLDKNPGFDLAITDATYISGDDLCNDISPELALKALSAYWQLTGKASNQLKTAVYNNLQNMYSALRWEKEHTVQRVTGISRLLTPKTSLALKREDLIFSEQIPLKGHPLHISAKTKTGFNDADVRLYSPEFGNKVPLHIVRIRKSLLQEYGNPQAWERYVSGIISSADFQRYCYVPVHPWQLEHIVTPSFEQHFQNGDMALIENVTLPASPTLSFRTLSLDQQAGLPYYHLKLPVKVQATSGIRVLSPRAVNNSILLSNLIENILGSRPDLHLKGRIAADVYGVHFQQSSDISFLLRNDPVEKISGSENIVVTAALVYTSNQITAPLLAMYMQLANTATDDYLLALFDALLTFPLRLFLEYGIAVEAHAQNTLLVLNKQHMPVSICLRDMSGVRCSGEHSYIQDLSANFREGERVILHYEEAATKLVHSLYYSLIGEISATISKYCHVGTTHIWNLVRKSTRKIIAQSEAGEADKQRLLSLITAPEISVKSLARMLVAGKSIDYIYTRVSNPLHEHIYN